MEKPCLKVALVQMCVGKTKLKNIQHAHNQIIKAAAEGVRIVALPEFFNSPYGNDYFDLYGESIPDGPTCQMLKEAAKENSLYVIGGSIPEVRILTYNI